MRLCFPPARAVSGARRSSPCTTTRAPCWGESPNAPARWASTAVQRAKAAANWDERDLHFHDLRGTAATKFYVAGLSIRVIAEIMSYESWQSRELNQGCVIECVSIYARSSSTM